MQWGLTRVHGWVVDRSIPATAHPVTLLVAPELCHQVEAATTAHRVTTATWLRQAMRQVTPADFPDSWCAGEGASRSHESGYDHRRFQLRLDPDTQRKLETFMQTFDRSAAEIIRQLMAQAKQKDFPQSCHLAVNERLAPPDHVEVPGV